MNAKLTLVEKVEALAAKGSHPGFISLLRVPNGHRLLLRNVKLWRDSEQSSEWFLEPLPSTHVENEWTEQLFNFGVGQDLFYRGALLFISKDGERRIERRDTRDAVKFANGNERSILDLGHYIGGLREDGAIIFQSDVERTLDK